MRPILGYWDIRGLGGYIRLLLEYAGVDYEDRRYKHGPPPQYDRTAWISVKDSLGLDFPNLPYYIDDDVKLTQSLAILRYLGRKHGLAGQDDVEQALIDMVEQQTTDIEDAVAKVAYAPSDNEKLKEELETQWLSERLAQMDRYLAKRQFIAGDRLTYADFRAYEAMDFVRIVSGQLLASYSNITSYLERFERLPKIKEYLTSPNYHRLPIYGPEAKIGGKRE